MMSDGFWDDGRLKKEILQHLDNETFRFTRHAVEEQAEDGIDLVDTLHVLRYGKHDKTKTCFDNKSQSWRYAITGKAEDLRLIRVIISFSEKMMVITVFALKKNR